MESGCRNRWPAFDPLLSMNVCFACERLRGKGPSGQAVALRWSGRPLADCPAMLGLVAVAKLTSLTAFAAFKQTATSQLTKRAARAATSPALLGAPQARPVLPERAFAATVVVLVRRATARGSRQAAPGGGDLCGDEEVSRDSNSPEDCLCLANGRASWPGAACKARLGVGARSALRCLTRRGCLSAVSAANVASSAARPRAEHRSAVGAKRRPPQHEPPPGAACRDARTLRESSHSRRATKGPRRTDRCSKPASCIAGRS